MIQFNWKLHWNTLVVPHLHDPEVEEALVWGLNRYYGQFHLAYDPKDGPHSIGRGRLNGQKVEGPGTLSWYQPWGRCHHIAPFVWAVAKKMYPDFDWKFLTSDLHTVVVGLKDGNTEIVMDILYFEHHTAPESIASVKRTSYYLAATPEEVFKEPS